MCAQEVLRLNAVEPDNELRINTTRVFVNSKE